MGKILWLGKTMLVRIFWLHKSVWLGKAPGWKLLLANEFSDWAATLCWAKPIVQQTPCRVEASGWINPHVKHRHIIRLKPRLCKDSCWTEVSSMTKDIEFSPYLLGCQIYTGWYGIVLNNRCIEWCVFQ